MDRSDYGPSLWRHILRDQLEVDEADFWPCVQNGIKPDRGAPAPPQDSPPADHVHLLVTRVGLSRVGSGVDEQGGGGNQITAVLDRRRLISGKYRTPGIHALRQRGCNWHGAWNGEQRPRAILAGPKRCSNGCGATGPGSRRRSPCCGCCPHPSRHSTRKVSRPRYLPESTKAFWRAQLVR